MVSGPFERQPVAADRVEGGVRKRRIDSLERLHAGHLHVVLEVRTRRPENTQRGVGDFWTDPVSRDHGDGFGHKKNEPELTDELLAVPEVCVILTRHVFALLEIHHKDRTTPRQELEGRSNAPAKSPCQDGKPPRRTRSGYRE